MKKHPILTVLLILTVTVVVLGLIMTALSGFFGRSPAISFANKVGVIPITGTIRDSTETLKYLDEFAKDRSIKAIIVRIDSPGGYVGASQEIYREMMKTRKIKKIIVSMGDVAASGGYYIASAGNKIVADPGTLTGSIGAIMEYYQFQELAKKIGFGLEVVKSGEFKDMGSPARKLTKRDREILQGVIDDTKRQFVNAVAAGRNLPPDKVMKIADGRIFTGAMAKKYGLVDQLGNFEDAVSLAKKLAHIHGEVSLVYPRKEKLSLLDILLSRVEDSISSFITSRTQSAIEYKWNGFPD